MTNSIFHQIDIAVLVPCFNEEKTIGLVIDRYRTILPDSKIYVYDNCSTDNTAQIALEKKVNVFFEKRKGKGNVVRRMFRDIDADIYVLIDGDNTYEVEASGKMISQLIDQNLDMVVGKRAHENRSKVYPTGHIVGNKLITKTVSFLFGDGFTDMLSGYRVLSRRFVKSFTIHSNGFEIETEITVHALQLNLPSAEFNTVYSERPEGSNSKLRTFNDGFRILSKIILLLKEAKPFKFFGYISIFLFASSLLLGIPVIQTYIESGLVPRLPTAVLSASFMILSFTSLITSVILDALSRARLEQKKLAYLSIRK